MQSIISRSVSSSEEKYFYKDIHYLVMAYCDWLLVPHLLKALIITKKKIFPVLLQIKQQREWTKKTSESDSCIPIYGK